MRKAIFKVGDTPYITQLIKGTLTDPRSTIPTDTQVVVIEVYEEKNFEPRYLVKTYGNKKAYVYESDLSSRMSRNPKVHGNPMKKKTRKPSAFNLRVGRLIKSGKTFKQAIKLAKKKNPTAAERELAAAYSSVVGPGKAKVNPAKKRRKKAKRKNAMSPVSVTPIMRSVSSHLRPKVGKAPRASRGGWSFTPKSSMLSNPKKKKHGGMLYTLRYYSRAGKLIGSQKARVSLQAAKRAAKMHLGKTWLGRTIHKVQLSDARG